MRRTAAQVLGQLGQAEAVTPLVALLQDPVPYVRLTVVQVLGQLGQAEAVTPLVALLQDQDWQVRRTAALALGQLGQAEAVTPLVALLQDSVPEVWRTAALALEQLGQAEAVTPLVALLQDRNSEMRAKAAEALGQLGWAEAVSPLVARLQDSVPEVRRTAVQALGQLGQAEAVTPLVALLQNRNSEVRAKAAEALGQLGQAEAVTPLVALLQDPVPEVRRSAVLAIGKLLAVEKINLLKNLYQNEREELDVRLAAAAALMSLNQEEGGTFLTEKSRSQKVNERKKVAEILGEVLLDRGTSLLINMLTDEKRDVKIQAIESVGRSKARSAVFHIHETLKNSDAKIREVAVSTLGKIASPESVALLRTITMDQQERIPVRLAAITALGDIGTEEAVHVLLDILEQAEETYQLRTIMILGKIGSHQALTLLLKLLEKQGIREQGWRKIRDEDTNSYTEEQIAEWRKQLEKVKPKGYLESELAYAIAQIDPGNEGVKLLSHDLAAVREGAWLGLGKVGTVQLVKRLDRERKESPYPHFRHAAYRAIDRILIKIEAYGGEKEFEELEKLRLEVMDKEGVYTRVEWTIDRLKKREAM
jgi:HEAT repeat protein